MDSSSSAVVLTSLSSTYIEARAGSVIHPSDKGPWRVAVRSFTVFLCAARRAERDEWRTRGPEASAEVEPKLPLEHHPRVTHEPSAQCDNSPPPTLPSPKSKGQHTAGTKGVTNTCDLASTCTYRHNNIQGLKAAPGRGPSRLNIHHHHAALMAPR